MIDVKEAVRIAKENLVSLMGEDKISDVRLEEVEFDTLYESMIQSVVKNVDVDDLVEQQHWAVTLSYFSGKPNPLFSSKEQRIYKTFIINAETGNFVSMKIRELAQV